MYCIVKQGEMMLPQQSYCKGRLTIMTGHAISGEKQRLIIICVLTVPKLQITALRLQSVMLCQYGCPTHNKSQTIVWTIVMLVE